MPLLEKGAGAGLALRFGGDGVEAGAEFGGESFGTVLDLSAGSSSYIEDCQVCCQPIELRLSVAEDGSLRGVEAARTD